MISNQEGGGFGVWRGFGVVEVVVWGVERVWSFRSWNVGSGLWRDYWCVGMWGVVV